MHWSDCRRPDTYDLINTEVQSATLHHKDAIVCVSRPEKSLSLLQLHEHHVTAQFQEQGLLKVTQNPEDSTEEHMTQLYRDQERNVLPKRQSRLRF